MIFTPTLVKELITNQSRMTDVKKQLINEVRTQLEDDLVSLKDSKSIKVTVGLTRQVLIEGVPLKDAIDCYLKMIQTSSDLTASLSTFKDREWLFNAVFMPKGGSETDFIGYTMNYNMDVKQLIEQWENIQKESQTKEEVIDDFCQKLNQENSLQQYFILVHA